MRIHEYFFSVFLENQTHSHALTHTSKMATLEQENHQRDADFNKAMHGKSAQAKGGVAAMFSKDREAKKLAVDEYFKHFDNKTAEGETEEDRKVRPSYCPNGAACRMA